MLEFERYELYAGPSYRFAPDRRDFLKLLGGGVAVFLMWDPDAWTQEAGGPGRGEAMPQDIAAWLRINADGIAVFTGKAEMGQNIRTSLTQAVAEELRCPCDSISLVMADTDLTPYDFGTVGSRTTPTMAPQLRKMAAAARDALVALAAEKWHEPPGNLVASRGAVHNLTTGTSVSYAELTDGQQLAKTVQDSPALSAAADWRVAGQSLDKIDARDFVTGKHQYTSDVKRAGMLYGRVLRPTSYGAKLTGVDTSGAERISGALVVRDGDFTGVVAGDEYSATQAIRAMRADWKAEAQPSSKELYSYLKSTASTSTRGRTKRGSMETGLGAAHIKLDAAYTVPYIAHISLEPRAAVAEWNSDKLTVWTGTQRPFGVKSELAQAFGIPESRVRVIVPDTGSAYGGKHTGECAVEAARLAKAAGKPVKLIWTRGEEFMWAYFRPAGVIEIRSGARKDGVVTAWEYHNYNSGPSAIGTPYEIANQRIEFHVTKSPLRQGSYRGLAATANHFARESHMDDLAHAAGMDPLAFRYKNLRNPRIQAVLAAATERFGWGTQKTRPGQGVGLACGVEKGGYVACCADVTVSSPGQVKIERIVEAFECGAVVNPEHLKNQIEGAIMMALGGALFEGMEFENGRLLNGQLSRYRIPRFSDMPAIESVLVDRKDLPSAGAGETPIVGAAPAIGNAIFDATGIRLRTLPMLPALAAETKA